MFPGETVKVLNNPADPPKGYSGKYDHAVFLNELCRMSIHVTDKVLKAWAATLKPDGRMHIFVPSLEWCADQILSDSPSQGTLVEIYGRQTNSDEFFASGFTMRKLRAEIERAGLIAVQARTGEQEVTVGETDYICESHYVMVRSGDV